MGQQAHREKLGRKVLLVLRVQQALSGLLVHPALSVLMALPALRGQWGQLVHKVRPVRLGQLVLLVPRARREQ